MELFTSACKTVSRQKTKNQKRAKIIEFIALLSAASNILDIHHTLVAAEAGAGRTVAAGAEAGHTVAEAGIAASAEEGAGHTVAAGVEAGHTVVEADIAASAGVEAGCTADVAAAGEEEAGCRDPGVSVDLDWTTRFGFFRRRHVLPNVVAPRELVEFLRGQASAEQGWATKS